MSADRQQVRTAFVLKGPLDRGVLAASLNKLADRHELLRARFSGRGRTIPNRAGWSGGERPEHIEQHIAAHNEAELVHVDCRGVAPEDRTAHATALVYEIGDRPFDLERGPAWRTALMELSDDEHVLLLVVHHIVCDFRSVGLLWTDLKAIYEALLAKREPDLEPLTTSYAEFAESLRQTLDGPIGDRERA